ncbi:MAG: hypothetical protein FWE43_04610 [Streptococcaceae bacterium]|nr:hypothetical protein [Streptococcaceae bacterium]MCL2681752.1 hypothetical protein [Streptococcaceae bacterium]
MKSTTDPSEPKQPLEQGSQILQRQADNNAEQLKQAAAVYQEYQDNIKKSGHLNTEILKGIQTGEPLPFLFLKAIESIGLMTGDKLFLSQVEKYLKE